MTGWPAWRAIPGWEDLYEAGSNGQIKSLRWPGGRILAAAPNHAGYLQVVLCRDGNCQTRFVHGLVALAFHGPKPLGLQVCHNNGDNLDNRPDNLRYDTRSSNMRDRVRHGRDPNANKTACVQGHEFTPENTAPRSGRGGRRCRACYREWNRQFRQRAAA